MIELKELLYTIFLRDPPNLFDEFLLEIQKIYDEPAHNFTELRNRQNKKIRGDIFEDFCLLYLQFVLNNDKVWLLKDVPPEILTRLGMKRRDMGIDIIIEHNGFYKAVQCKYKKHLSSKKNILTWKVLSTFYALCLRTGPWEKYIIMTNCIYTLHQGTKTNKDISLCLKTLQNITKDEWLKMCCINGKKINESEKINESNNHQIKNIIKPSKENLRELRIKFLEKK